MYRFAPSPTKDMDINDLRIALFNFICAKQSGDMFVVRIEDSDKENIIEGKDQEILDILAIFGITYDNLYYQSENFKYHLQFASSLMDKKQAFACFCTPKELKNGKCSGACLHVSEDELLNNNLPFTIRVKKPQDERDNFVIMSQKKYPTYDFASAIDDMIQGVKYVIRSEEHLKNSPKQELVRDLIGYEDKIEYTHLPNISNETNVKWLLDQGYMPEAIINYLILLGNKTPSKIFTITEALSWFELKNLSKSAVKFDIEELKSINKEHIKLVEDVELSRRIGYSCASIGKLAKLYTQECDTTFDIKQKVDTIFAPKISDEYKEGLDKLKLIVKDAPYFEEFNEFKKYLEEKSGLKGKDFINPFNILLIGEKSGINVEKIYPLIKNYLQETTK